MSTQPLQFLFLLFASWVNRRQLEMIEYRKEENTILREQLGGKPIQTRALVVRMAVDNPRWGYTKIRGALHGLGIELGRNTIKRILLERGITPAPERGKRMPRAQPVNENAPIECRERLGGVLKYYYRAA